MPRPVDNVLPLNHALCLICGAAFGFEAGVDDLREYRQFLSEHRLCRLLGMPSCECQVDDCRSTAVGPAQRCPAHGGGRLTFRDRLTKLKEETRAKQ